MPNAIVNGISIDYSTAADGPPVLLICGTGQPADLWFAQVTDLAAAGHTVITFDNRGCGRSEAAVASMFGDPVQGRLALGDDSGGVFDLDSRGAVTLTVTRAATAGPPAAQLTDALAGRAPAAAVLGDLPPSTRAALSHLADFFNTPVEQHPA